MRTKDLRRSSASPEVLSPSAHTGRAALSGFAVLQTIPLRCYACPTRAGADLLTTFTLAVFRCWRMRCESARCGGRAGLSVPVGSAARSRRQGGLLLEFCPSSFDRPVRAPPGKPANRAHRRSIQFKRYRLAFSARPSRVMRQRISWRGVPLPVRAYSRGLVGRSGPSLDSPNGAHGVQPFAGLLPQAGWFDISAQPGPRVVRASRPPRFIFVGVTARLSEQIIERRSAKDEDASTSGLRSRL